MDWFAYVVRWLIAPLWAAYERSPYLRHYRTVLRTQWDSPAVIRARQQAALAGIVRHAYKMAPFWRERLVRSGISSDGNVSFDSLRAVPLLTKDDLRRHGSHMLSSDVQRSELIRRSTSGSTGTPVEVFAHDSRQQWTRACVLRSDEWSGWRLGERMGALWGNPEYLKHGWRGRVRNALLERITYLDTLKMDMRAMAKFAARLRRRPPSLLFGHAHSLYLFAQFLKARAEADIRPRGIISSAMVLHDWERRTIEEVFRCAVTNRYGCEEVGLIACQCELHEALHINADCVYVEVLRSDGTAAAPDEPGMIVVTDLVNRAMPIIRYQVGDMGVLSDRQCPCGRGLPLLEKVEGRIADYVVTPRGELISGISLTENFAVMVPGLAQLQIVQEEVDRFVFRIVKAPDFGQQSLETIRALVAERFGPGVRHECDFVDRIPQEPSGKYRFCISKVQKHFLSV